MSHLSWVWSLHALYRQRLGSWPWVSLLWHSLPMGTKGTHPRRPGLVHTHRRPAHTGRCHSCSHACWIHVAWHRSRAPRARLVHKLVVVSLSGTHLERGTNLQRKKKKKRIKCDMHLQWEGGAEYALFAGWIMSHFSYKSCSLLCFIFLFSCMIIIQLEIVKATRLIDISYIRNKLF